MTPRPAVLGRAPIAGGPVLPGEADIWCVVGRRGARTRGVLELFHGPVVAGVRRDGGRLIALAGPNRAWPLGVYVYSLVLVWSARTGRRPEILAGRQFDAPWCPARTEPVFADPLFTQLRRVTVTARMVGDHPAWRALTEIRQVCAVWRRAAA